MNQGTARGDADGYHLDILPKLKDVKSQVCVLGQVQNFWAKEWRYSINAYALLPAVTAHIDLLNDSSSLQVASFQKYLFEVLMS